MTQALDRLGHPIEIGSIIVIPYTTSRLGIARVTNISKTSVGYEDMDREVTGTSQMARPTYRKRHNEVVVIDKLDHLVMHLMSLNLN